ncbi:deoxyhypusine monooxygenase [Aureococcus anophagefferens]|nr:deoxyhypusine monooxygenase [Aureococcus anophagefferens]
MAAFEAPPLPALVASLVPAAQSEVADLPVAQRMRAAYWLKHVYERDATARGDARRALEAGMRHRAHGSLLRHECAYVLGQLRDAAAQASLEAVLGDEEEDAMLRHECAEALGAIGVGEAALARLAGSPDAPWEVAQTCEIAVDFLRPFNSHDPAPPDPDHASWTAEALGSRLSDAGAPIFERYRAMFSLRNRGGERSVAALGRALVGDGSSPLLRHEVAFVLGQLQHPAALPFLAESLRRAGEHAIVRHEAAEAIGALEGCWDACEAILTEFAEDADAVIAQSCEVALDAADYFGRTGRDDDDDGVSFANLKEGQVGLHFNLATQLTV